MNTRGRQIRSLHDLKCFPIICILKRYVCTKHGQISRYDSIKSSSGRQQMTAEHQQLSQCLFLVPYVQKQYTRKLKKSQKQLCNPPQTALTQDQFHTNIDSTINKFGVCAILTTRHFCQLQLEQATCSHHCSFARRKQLHLSVRQHPVSEDLNCA